MVALTVAVVLLAALCLLNLAVTAAVIRRLRDAASGRAPQSTDDGIQLGESVPTFAVRTDSGAELTDRELRQQPVLLAFFATTCPECALHAPELAERGPALASAGVRVVPVLLDTGADTRGLRTTLAGLGDLVTTEAAAELGRRFRTRATPSYLLIGLGGTVIGRGATLSSLPLPQAALPQEQAPLRTGG